MTALALVTETYTEPDYLDSESAPVLAADLDATEKAIIKAYVKKLKGRGFCILNDSSANYTRLFNRYEDTAIPMSWLHGDFIRHLVRVKKSCRLPTTNYLTLNLEHIIGKKFVPNAGEFFTSPISECTYANTYRAYQPTSSNKDLSPLFTKFFERLITNEADRHLVLQWLSHIFQYPEQRPSWHVMMPSDTGVGKGFLVEKILQPLLHHTSVISSFGRLTGRFSTLLEDKLFLLLDDCKARSESQQTQLKSLLSEERAYVEHKGKDAGMVNTYTRMILASNESKPLDLEENERRWFVLEKLVHKESPEETQSFIAELTTWLNLPCSLDAVHNFFMHYNLDDFNHKQVRKTQALLNIVQRSKGIHGDLLADFILDNEVFTTADWMVEYERQGLPKLRDAKAIPALLAEAGYEKDRPTVHGERQTLCYPIGWSPEQIEAVYPKKPGQVSTEKTGPACEDQPF